MSSRCEPITDDELREAYSRTVEAAARDPEGFARRLRARETQPTYARPLRSWCLAIRASDARIDLEDLHCGCYRRVVVERDNPDEHWLELNAAAVRKLTARVVIDWPGVPVREAARRCGANPTTVRAWARRGLVRVDRYENRADRKRDEVRVWTPGYHGVDPTGEVDAADWGETRIDLTSWVPDGFRQWVGRRRRRLSRKAVVHEWRCAGCGGWAAKLYRPVPPWTVASAMSETARAERRRAADDPGRGFACRRCVGLIYESSERTSRPAEHRTLDHRRRTLRRMNPGER